MKTKYLYYANKGPSYVGAFIEIDSPSGSDHKIFEQTTEKFAAFAKVTVENVLVATPEPVENGLFVKEELHSSAGIHLTIFCPPEHNPAHVVALLKRYRRERDVCSSSIKRFKILQEGIEGTAEQVGALPFPLSFEDVQAEVDAMIAQGARLVNGQSETGEPSCIIIDSIPRA